MKTNRLTIKVVVVVIAAILFNYPIIAIVESNPQPVSIYFVYLIWAVLIVIYFIFSLKRFK